LKAFNESVRLPGWLTRNLPAIALFVVLVGAWQAAVTGFGVREYILPSPLTVLRALMGSEIPWAGHVWITTLEIVGAFLLAGAVGVLLGTAIAWSPVLAMALVPFLVFVNTLPKVAVAPLFLLWLGYGIVPNMLIGALIGFFPVVINTAVGLTQVDEEMLDLGRVFSAPKWKVFALIRIPNAYPYILSALKVTATAAVVGAIVGEFVASQKGLGYVIVTTQGSMNTPVAFAALVWISVVGLAVYGAVVLAARWIAPWAEAAD
jgi:NitT/TauT family transport system permease protein